jgi:hypothetical protein
MRRLLLLFWLMLAGFGLGMTAPSVVAQSIMERLVTPGPLSRAHAKLENKCSACHASFQRESENRQCIACHAEVGRDVASAKGFHGRFAPARSQTCRSCHSEHRGREHGIVTFTRNGFNHNFTDYPLTGGHAKVVCASCHIPGKKFRGTTTSCANCHVTDEPHKGRLGRACQSCHKVTNWKDLKPFDHRARAGFALTGAHTRTTCASCHRGEQWAGLGSACIDCHRKDDTHRGARGTNCASCHRTTRWAEVTFDHDSTGFSLIGGHAAASCTGCHGVGNSVRKPSRSCIACHRSDDVHKGGNGEECSDCHTPRGWSRVRFDHDAMTRFPLKGAHRQAQCAACHREPPRVAKPPATCIGCHAVDDHHEGRNGTDCARCHVETGWNAVTFNHDTMTKFPLRGAHSRATCESCHTAPPETVRPDTACASCHADDDPHVGNLGTNCARCHDSEDWITQIRFDHDLTRFPLLGSHAGRECTACHADKRFVAKGTACADCHTDDYHQGRLGTPADCKGCHNTRDWKNWSFDHDRQTRFALTGRHRGLVCSACHSRAGDPAQKPSNCIDCHRRDDRHRGEFGEDCERCHVTDSFSAIILP